MNRLFVYTAPFRSCWKAMGLSDDDLLILEEMLLENPQRGDVIEGTGGARKMRLYFLFAYPKNVQENLTPEQKKAIRKMIEEIKKE